MHKIEQAMVAAVERGAVCWERDNTMVTHEGMESDVFLHGNHIATVGPSGVAKPNLDTVRVWPTATMRSRLRALGVDVTKRDHVIYINGKPVAEAQ